MGDRKDGGVKEIERKRWAMPAVSCPALLPVWHSDALTPRKRQRESLSLHSFVMLSSKCILCQLKSVCQALWRQEGCRFLRSRQQVGFQAFDAVAVKCFYFQPGYQAQRDEATEKKKKSPTFSFSVAGYWVLCPNCGSLKKLFSLAVLSSLTSLLGEVLDWKYMVYIWYFPKTAQEIIWVVHRYVVFHTTMPRLCLWSMPFTLHSPDKITP